MEPTRPNDFTHPTLLGLDARLWIIVGLFWAGASRGHGFRWF